MRFAVVLAGMLSALAAGMALLPQACVAAPPAPPATRPAWLPEDYAATFEAADRRRADELAFLKDAYAGQYSAGGNRSPKWNVQAIKALDAWVTGFVVEISDRDTDSVLWYEGQGAISAGCNDPLLMHAVARNKLFWQGDGPEIRNLEIKAGRGMKESSYDGIPRIICLLRGAQYLGDPQYVPTAAEKAEAMSLVALAREQVGAAVRQEDLPRHEMVNVLVAAGETSAALTGDRWKLAEGIYQAIEAQNVDRSTLLSMKGQLYVEYAADGERAGADPMPEGTTSAEQRQAMAQKLLEEAWSLDHGNTWASLWLMRLARARAAGDEEVMKWFRRTLDADPDVLEAYQDVRDYLSGDAALDFGRECAQWLADRSECRLMIVDLHLAAAGPIWRLNSATDQPYFKGDEQIWKDVSAAYEPYIKSRKLSQHHYIRYALIAMWCGQWERARELLDAIKEYRGHREVSARMFADMRHRIDAHFKGR